MKKIAAASLGLALWMGGSARAQSPFFQPAPQPVQPAAAMMPAAPQFPAGNVVPVRVHFGGALTTDGVVPVPVYLNQPVGPMSFTPPPAQSSPNVRQVSTRDGRNTPVATPENDYAPEVTDPRFVAPHPDDLYRPYRTPTGYRWYTSLEYLQYLFVRQQNSPPLVQIDGIPLTANDLDAKERMGGRVTIGHWLHTDCVPCALEATFTFFGQRHGRHDFASNGVSTIEHPFFDALDGVPDTVPVATDFGPDSRSGVSQIETSSRMMSFEVNLRRELLRSCHGHLDLIGGYRQFHLDESIAIRDRTIYDTGPFPLSDATVIGVDEFGTHNVLFAGQLGLEAEFNWRGFFIDGWGKLALGGNDEVINISGFTQVGPTPGRLPPPPPSTNGKSFPGSVYTQPSNIGRYEQWSLTALPEVGVNAGYAITSNIRISAGYHFFFINNIVRPGDAIDPTISRNQIPQLQQPLAQTPGARPAPPSFVESSYWAHGLSAQIEFRY